MVSWFQLSGPFVRAGVSVLAATVLSTAAMAGDEGAGDDPFEYVDVGGGDSDGELVIEDEGWIVDDETMNAGGGGGDETGEGDGAYPEYEEMVSDCGGCEMQTFGGTGGQPELENLTPAPGSERETFVLGPDVCEQPGSIGWLCDWQKGALGQ